MRARDAQNYLMECHEEDLLVADIGATHARFACADTVEVFDTADFADTADLLDAACAKLGMRSPKAACFAVAGPVVDGIGTITNGALSFSRETLRSQLAADVLVVNDFYALARGVPDLENLEQLGGDAGLKTRESGAVRAVVGPGSGLGMSLLIPRSESGWLVLPSEGGHADFAPHNHLEQEVLSILLRTSHNVCWESVVSGPGLVNLYGAVCELWGTRSESMTAEEISARGVNLDDPICHQTLELFFAMLGSVAGNLALTVCARGGVYIGGGIVPHLKDFALSSSLRRRFEERAELEDYIRDIPLYLILDEYPGLTGARACLTDLLKQT